MGKLTQADCDKCLLIDEQNIFSLKGLWLHWTLLIEILSTMVFIMIHFKARLLIMHSLSGILYGD